ncbi:MAG: LrgB family protein [Gemmatimonadaceae bacterium]|nr:LrgB family protein [Gemmatimonadaceae bacterium]
MTPDTPPRDLFQLWVYLSSTPLFGLAATLIAYVIGLRLQRAARGHPLANPVLLAISVLAIVLQLTGIAYPRYFEGAQFVHFLLGPATVAFAVPLVTQLPTLVRLRWPLLVALAAGGIASGATAVLVAWLLGASDVTILSLVPKSITAPIAMGISEQIGGVPTLTAVFCIFTGILGASLSGALLTRLGIHDRVVRGFALGNAAHGIGAAQAFQEDTEAGAFAGLALALHGLIGAVAIPATVLLFRR